MYKRVVNIQIDDCVKCPNAKLKTVKDEGTETQTMFCQTERSCVTLREGFGPCLIPDWCPKLKEKNFHRIIGWGV